MLRTVVLLSLPFAAGCMAHAHVATPIAAVVSPAAVSVNWVWVAPPPHRRGHVRVDGHWYHPHYGKSYRAHTAGPPPRRPHGHAHWTPGHWEGRGKHRHWVPGQWK